MKLKFLFVVIFLLSCTFSWSQSYPGTNVRGRVITYNYNQPVPLSSAKVDLYIFDGTRPPGYQWIIVGTTLTDSYGFYFFKGIIPGNYVIWINQIKSYNVQIIAIDYRYYSFQDLPQLIF